MSAGLIGEASSLAVTRSECGGERECVWRFRTSFGSP